MTVSSTEVVADPARVKALFQLRTIAAVMGLAPTTQSRTLPLMTDRITATEDRLAALSDADLIAEWDKTDGEPGDPLADLIAGELERRNLDV